MIGFILPVLVRWGVPQRLQRFVAWATLIVGALLLCGALWGAWTLWLSNRDEAQREVGAAVQREGNLKATIDQVEKANAAADTIRRSSDAARDECLRNARNPADC